MDEQKRLDYTLKEYETLIEEIGMQINVIRQSINIDDDTKFEMVNVLKKKQELLKKDILKPYFARIDFVNRDNVKDICYISKNGVINNDNEIITVDWRAPISTLYYDANIGKCTYESPSGNISGELLLKRQYEIDNSKLISYKDVDVVLNDDILKEYLDVNADNRLKNIVASIQSEQNQIIREKINKNIVVQGVAGSGKTTVALHRIAYLVYNYRDTIKPEQFMIIGPNKFFVTYISNVLPDLDVNDVKQLDFVEFVMEYLNESFIISDKEDDNSTLYKTSIQYKYVIDKYVEDLEKKVVPDLNLKMYEFDIMDSNHIKKVYNSVSNNYKSILSKVEKTMVFLEKEISTNNEKIILKLNKYTDNLFNKQTSKKEKDNLIKKREIIKKEINSNCHNILKKYFNIVNEKIIKLYKTMMKNIDKYENNNKYLKYFKEENLNIISYDDLIALVYLKYKIHGSLNYNKYKHIVIDEAQDYNTLVFYTLNKIFNNATFSIFGDLAQAIFSYRSIENWDILRKKIANISILELSKSYRSTVEIMNEANKINRFLNLNEANSVIRHGKKPEYYKINDYEFILNKINEMLHRNYKTIAIISKNQSDSNNIYKYLKNQIDVININADTNEYYGGVCTVTSSLCKGLEFDCVILNNVDNDIYNINNITDMKLLYVSMTRPLHELVITYKKSLVNILK